MLALQFKMKTNIAIVFHIYFNILLNDASI